MLRGTRRGSRNGQPEKVQQKQTEPAPSETEGTNKRKSSRRKCDFLMFVVTEQCGQGGAAAVFTGEAEGDQLRRKRLLPLLDKSQGRRRFFTVLKPSDQYFSDTVFAHGEQQVYDGLKAQCPGTDEIPAVGHISRGVPHFPDHRMQHPPQKLRRLVS